MKRTFDKLDHNTWYHPGTVTATLKRRFGNIDVSTTEETPLSNGVTYICMLFSCNGSRWYFVKHPRYNKIRYWSWEAFHDLGAV